MVDEQPDISFIIPSYDNGSKVLECLKSLREQSSGASFEIVVTDSSDDDFTFTLLESEKSITLLKSQERLYPGAARNLGARSASGNVLFFIDDDCRASLGLAEILWKLRPDLNRTVVGGAILSGIEGSFVASAEYFSECSPSLPGNPPRDVDFVASAGLGIGAEAFRDVGGFPGYPAGEDVVFGERCRKAGLRPIFDPRISITHTSRTDLRGFLSNQRKLGRGAGSNRSSGEVPRDSWIARQPLVWPLIPFARFLRIAKRTLRYGRGQRWAFIRSSPVVFLGAFYFAAGFARGVRDGRTGRGR